MHARTAEVRRAGRSSSAILAFSATGEAPVYSTLHNPTDTGATVIGPIAEPEIDELAALMLETIRPLAYYNERAIRAELTKYSANRLRARAEGDSHAVLVARDERGLTGFCVSRFDDGTVWLDWFGVAERARGRGIGTALLAALAATLPARRAHKIWCDSRTDNKESLSVLERAGYRRITTLTNHWYGKAYFLWEWYPLAGRSGHASRSRAPRSPGKIH